MSIISTAPIYILVTNQYFMHYAPLLFGKLPGDDYHAFIKYVILFIALFVVTMIIYKLHNNELLNDSSVDNDVKDAIKNNSTAFSDALTILTIVLLFYFIVSMLIMPVQLLKIRYDTWFNTIFFIVTFGLVGTIYTLFADKIAYVKASGTGRNTFFGIVIFVLLILYILNDEKISGTIPGINLIPSNIKKMINLAIKVDNLRTGDNAGKFENELKSTLTANGKITENDVSKLLDIANASFAVIPKEGIKLLEMFKKETKILDKLLGPIDLKNQEQFIKIIEHPLIKIMLILMKGIK